MSAIWGCVDFSGNLLPQGLSETMENPFHEYKIDRYTTLADGNILMGCGHQHIHREDVSDSLPVFVAEEELYFVADCIVDNRDDLIAALCPGKTDISDGNLLLLAYRKWGEDTPQKVYGAYSFAAYDKRANKLILCADHVFSRSIYYCFENGKLYFSTIIEPTLKARGGNAVLNNTWVAFFLSINSLSIMDNPVETPYDGVKRVQAAHYVVFDLSCSKNIEYWSPKKIPPLRLGSDEDYKKRFREIYETSCRQILRTDGEVGVMLSSGLDSSSVAALASMELAKRGKSLHAYTHVPVDNHTNQNNPRFSIADERPGVEEFCGLYPNIKPNFLPMPEENAFVHAKEILSIFEVPFKSLTNVAWITAFTRQAAEDGCKILLTGQVGNSTVSRGSFDVFETTRLLHGRLISAKNNLSLYCRQYKIPRKWKLKNTLLEMTPRFILLMLSRKDFFLDTPVNREFAKEAGFKRRDRRLIRNTGAMGPFTFRKETSMIYSPVALAHISDDETKNCLKFGIVLRDPTRDIRMYEFCLAAPMECFVRSGTESRRLIRSYLSDMLPAKMIAETAPRGSQSDDWATRLEPEWPKWYNELVRVCRSSRLDSYISRARVDELLEIFKLPPKEENYMDFVQIGNVYMIGLLLESRDWASPSK